MPSFCSLSYLFLLYLPRSLSLGIVFDAISSHFASVFVLGNLKVRDKDWLTYSGNRSDKLHYNFSFSDNLAQIVNFPTRVSECDFHSRALPGFSRFPKPINCSAVSFLPLGNSDAIVVSVSIGFL